MKKENSSPVKWKNVTANTNLIECTTPSSVLIKIPKEEYKFWHPKKLVNFYGKNNYAMRISFTDEFKFKLFRNGKGRFNSHKKIEEKEIDTKEFESFF